MTLGPGDMVMLKRTTLKVLVVQARGQALTCVWLANNQPRWSKINSATVELLETAAQRETRILAARKRKAMAVAATIPAGPPKRGAVDVIAELKAELAEAHAQEETRKTQFAELQQRTGRLAQVEAWGRAHEQTAKELAEMLAAQRPQHDAAVGLADAYAKRVKALEGECAALAEQRDALQLTATTAMEVAKANAERIRELITELEETQDRLALVQRTHEEDRAWQQRAVRAEQALAARPSVIVPPEQRDLSARVFAAETSAKRLQTEVAMLKEKLGSKQQELDVTANSLSSARARAKRAEMQLQNAQRARERPERCPSCESTKFVPVSGGRWNCIECNHRWGVPEVGQDEQGAP